uniref:Fructose-bisphosphatase n=1 Tax=Rhodosorus marinus TaxID=101924 RepID=A0A7S2ZWI6_9RHOD|mmetsp:Transcript_35562/g.141825  ORF Transcript_35562/g.141825 Transcript_35562/m.141825 type:complete len:348 (+) Transcript_35562:346-1389(+)
MMDVHLKSPMSPLGGNLSSKVSKAATVFPSHVRRTFMSSPVDYTGEIVRLLDDIATQTHAISAFVAEGSETITYGEVGTQQITSEFATRLLYRSLAHDGYSCLILAKSREQPLTFPEEVPHGGYVVCISALDADPRAVDQPVCGTIFSVYKRKSSTSLPGKYIDLKQKASDQVAAGFVVYGPSTVLYYTMGHGLYSFVLHPVAMQYFLQPDQRLTIKESSSAVYGKRTIVSSNTALGKGVKNYVDSNHDVKMYHTGCMAGNVALMLPNGGALVKPDAHLLCECAPLAFIIEQAGGVATDGEGTRILDLTVGDDYHMKVNFLAGVEEIVHEIESLGKGKPAADTAGTK